MPAGQIGTMADGLMQILTTLAGMKVAPDADPDLLANLESIIVTGIQNAEAGKLGEQMSAMSPGGSSAPAMGSGMGMGPPPPSMPSMPGMGGGATNPTRPAPPNPDELRRIMSLG